MSIGRHAKYPSFLHLIKLEFSIQNFKKVLIIEFHENPSSGSRIVS
jgi:hypothetical protein